jgi:hypothetical protein
MIWKVFKFSLKIVGTVLGLGLLFIVGYIILNMPFGAKYKNVSDSMLKACIDYLDTHISDPLPFVSQKFKTHDVILVGEIHRRKQDVELVKSLIPYLYEKNGITVFAWQFGASDFQGEVDALVNASEFDERKAIQLMRRWTYFWNYQEYLDIYRVIWRLNREIPAGREKIRFLQLGSDYIERKFHSSNKSVRTQERKRYIYSKKMAEIIEREVLLKGKKALWYSGIHHAFTRYRQPRFFFRHRTGEKRRGGNVLYDKYPDSIYLIALHLPVASRGSMFKADVMPLPFLSTFYYPFGSVIDQVYNHRKHPFAFDTGSSPFGKLKDNYSYYSVDHWGGIRLMDFCDGYIVPCSFEEAEPVTAIESWITSQDELEEVKNTLLPSHADRIQNISDFLKSLDGDKTDIFKSQHNMNKKEFIYRK